MNIFTKKKGNNQPATYNDLGQGPDPQTAVDFFRRGMKHYARREYASAEADFSISINLDLSSIDTYYSLGMVFKAQNNKDAAIQSFQRAIDLILVNPGEKKSSRDILRRLALGHINELTQGDWNLEKEIWQHEE